MDYSAYKDLKVRLLEPGILEIAMGEEGKLAVATENAHAEMARIWLDVDRDPQARVAILRGAGKGFSAGGDLAMVEKMTQDFDLRARVWREARDLVYNMINCSKIIVSAIHGPAVGAGLVAGLLADISIAARTARLIDGHTRLGVAAGDHAAIVWPLLCGMAKAQYYLLTCKTISGEGSGRRAPREEKRKRRSSRRSRRTSEALQDALLKARSGPGEPSAGRPTPSRSRSLTIAAASGPARPRLARRMRTGRSTSVGSGWSSRCAIFCAAGTARALRNPALSVSMACTIAACARAMPINSSARCCDERICIAPPRVSEPRW